MDERKIDWALRSNDSLAESQHQHHHTLACKYHLHATPGKAIGKSVITSADGPIVAPAYVAVSHAETADALRALQFITLVAREMHRGSPPGDPSQRGKNVLTAKVSWKNTKVLSSSGAADNVTLMKTHRGYKALWNNVKYSF